MLYVILAAVEEGFTVLGRRDTDEPFTDKEEAEVAAALLRESHEHVTYTVTPILKHSPLVSKGLTQNDDKQLSLF